jgi:mannose-6-phosphate isomerase-like protein (cupin superfamily)
MRVNARLAVTFCAGVAVGAAVTAAWRLHGTSAEHPCPWAESLDAVVSAPQNHRVLLENDKVRVLDVVVAPGAREPLHAHCWPSVLTVLQGGRARDYDADGKISDEGSIIPSGKSAPFSFWLQRTPPHSVENLDSIPIHLIRVEMKP